MIVIGLSSSRIETKKIYSFLKNEDYVYVNHESDIDKISWNNSENIIFKRIEFLEKAIYNNTFNKKKQFKLFGEVCFYVLPYLEMLISNFPHLKFICTSKSRKKTYNDIIEDLKNRDNFFLRLLFFRKKFKNHFIDHNGKKWEKDYILDKCYPKFDSNSLKNSVEQYIDLYYHKIKVLEKKYPNNLKIFYSDELKSKYGKEKIFSFIGLK